MVKKGTKMKLPKPLKSSDIKWSSKRKHVEGLPYSFEMYLVNGEEWHIATLAIGGSSRRNTHAQRTYSITLEGKICRVGKGPHVTNTIQIYVGSDNAKRLKPLLDLLKEGEVKAHSIRDRISSRRAEGQLHREAGQSSWRWGTM
jgi:hypothetical protein